MKSLKRNAKVIVAIVALAGSLLVANFLMAPAPACAAGKCQWACMEHEYCNCYQTCKATDAEGRCLRWEEECHCTPKPDPTPPQGRRPGPKGPSGIGLP
jgi:hypothetical protein